MTTFGMFLTYLPPSLTAASCLLTYLLTPPLWCRSVTDVTVAHDRVRKCVGSISLGIGVLGYGRNRVKSCKLAVKRLLCPKMVRLRRAEMSHRRMLPAHRGATGVELAPYLLTPQRFGRPAAAHLLTYPLYTLPTRLR